MAAPELAVLLRTCTHANVGANATSFGYALKCDNVSIAYAKTPIQVPVPQQPPQLIDLGIYRPTITLSGTVDTLGGDTSNTTSGFEGMESMSYIRATGYGSHASAKTYYVPYKNKLESFASTIVHSQSNPIEIEWGDASFPDYSGSPTPTHSTGGAVYLVALQQFRVQLDAAKEDRYTFSMQFAVGARKDS